MNQSEQLDRRLDNLVDNRQLSYSEAAALLDVPVHPLAAVMADRTAHRAAAYAENAEDFNLTGSTELSPEQVLINRAGAAAVRAAIAAAKAERT